jgi:xanthine dehydrogenase accessory factor
MKNIYFQIPLESVVLSRLALATVTGSEGSTPQKPGSSALFSEYGLVAGTIGGGVLEGKVTEMARRVLKTGNPVHQVFHLDTNASDGEDALCGGRIEVLIDPDLVKHLEIFSEVQRCIGERIPGILISMLKIESQGNVVIERYWKTKMSSDYSDVFSSGLPPDFDPGTVFSEAGQKDFRTLKLPAEYSAKGFKLLLEPVFPLPNLVIAGAGHIGKALSLLGNMLDFDVTVIDDRPEYANKENLPHASRIIADNIARSVAALEKGTDTYIVIVTRGHRDDGDTLRACIESDAAYIGMIGSRNKIALMKREFLEKGYATEAQWSRIYAPIGLDIGSKTVEEIAVSIAAQLVKIRRS